MMTKLTEADIAAVCAVSPRLLVACDFDGTLCRIARWPDLVYLPDHARDTLRRLGDIPSVAVSIVSGRRIEDVQERIGLPLIYAGNHGLEIRSPEIAFTHPAALEVTGVLQQLCCELGNLVKRWRGAWVECKGLTATVHFRNVVADEQHRVAMAVRKTALGYGSLFALRSGKRALEIRPRNEWNKGAAVAYIRERIGFDDATCICIGDDATDETMFRAFPEHMTVRVGWHAGSAARYYVDDPSQVHDLLEHLTAAVSAAPERGVKMGRSAGSEASLQVCPAVD